MARSELQKLKILYIKEYLERKSSAERCVSAKELIDYLASKGIASERKSIYRDIEALEEFGMDICRQAGMGGGFYLGDRPFELPELKLLIDAVQSSRFLTEKKSRALVKKLCALCSQDEELLLRRQIAVAGRVKSMNENVLYNVDAIQEAMRLDNPITFRYFDWDMDHRKKFREKYYEASPYALLWENENYYLIAQTAERGITHYRVDRMQNIRLLSGPRLPCPELKTQKFADYSKMVFQMYQGDTVEVKLRFHKSLINVIFDRFGGDCMLIPDGPEHVTFTQKVEVSPMFLSWVIGFGSKAKILHPASVAQACRELALEAAGQYI